MSSAIHEAMAREYVQDLLCEAEQQRFAGSFHGARSHRARRAFTRLLGRSGAGAGTRRDAGARTPTALLATVTTSAAQALRVSRDDTPGAQQRANANGAPAQPNARPGAAKRPMLPYPMLHHLDE